jgi:hypothetical protein
VAGDEDDGQGRAAFDQAALQLQPGHATHADIDNQAGHFARVVAAQERLGGVKTAHPVTFAFEQPLQRITHGLVVINNVNQCLFWESSSFSVPGFLLLDR